MVGTLVAPVLALIVAVATGDIPWIGRSWVVQRSLERQHTDLEESHL